MPDSTQAQQAALDAYNIGVTHLNDANAKLAAIRATDRPPDVYGQDNTAAKEYDLNFKQAQAAVADAQTEAAQAARAYSTIIEQQANQAAQANTPDALANADRARAMAEYYRARADGFAAKDAAAQTAAQTRADAALQRANTAASRVDAQNNQANAAAANANASAVSTAARTPSEIAQAEASAAASRASAANVTARTPSEIAAAQAQANAANASAANTAARTPAEIAQAEASANASNANAVDAQARANLANLQAEQLASNDPLVKAHLQAQIDQLNTQTAALGKPTIEPGYQNASQIPMIVKGPDGQWTVQWVANQGQNMTSTAALTTLADTLSLHLGDGDNQIPVQTAKDLFSIANDVYKSQTDRQVANNQGANIGAGLLQNRVSAVGGQENALLGLAGSKNFGLGGPLPAGLWSGVHNEVMGNMTQAGGGQSTYDTAAALVHQAAPQLQATPAGAAHVAVVQQMLDAGQKPSVPLAGMSGYGTPSGYQGAPNPNVFGSGTGSFQAPTVKPDPVAIGTAVGAAIQHLSSQPDFAAASINDPSRGGGFQAPRMM